MYDFQRLNNKRKYLISGVTLVELLLVISIAALIGGASVSFSSGFLSRNNFRNTSDVVVNSLRIAQLNAISAKADSNWGVRITPVEVVIYAQNNSDLDSSYTIPGSVNIGEYDILFGKINGVPSSSYSIIVSTTNETQIINVNEVGIIDVN